MRCTLAVRSVPFHYTCFDEGTIGENCASIRWLIIVYVDGASAPMHDAHAIDSCSGRYVEEEGRTYPDCGNILEKFLVNICVNKRTPLSTFIEEKM